MWGRSRMREALAAVNRGCRDSENAANLRRGYLRHSMAPSATLLNVMQTCCVRMWTQL